MNTTFCPEVDEITTDSSLCATCLCHTCSLCDDEVRFDADGERVCLGCHETEQRRKVEAEFAKRVPASTLPMNRDGTRVIPGGDPGCDSPAGEGTPYDPVVHEERAPASYRSPWFWLALVLVGLLVACVAVGLVGTWLRWGR